MKKSDRPNLKIDIEPIVEIDINASYLSILLTINGFCNYFVNGVQTIKSSTRYW